MVSALTQSWAWKAGSFSQAPGLAHWGSLLLFLGTAQLSPGLSPELKCLWVPEVPNHPLPEASVLLPDACDHRDRLTTRVLVPCMGLGTPTPSRAESRSPSRLKTISLVIRSTQGAEEVLKAHEDQLKEAQAVPATLPELDATKAALKVPGPRREGRGLWGPEAEPWG